MRLSLTLLSILTLIILTASQCKKNKPENPVDQLPAETQTGANTFGCLVNGKVFKPGGASLTGGSLSCTFQYLGTGINGGFHFRLAAISRNNNTGESKSIGLFTDSLKIVQGTEYTFTFPNTKGKAYALYGYSTTNPMLIDDYATNNINSGKMLIKKFDPVTQIVSGTFWFDAVNANGQKVEVREGRFDVRYTQ